MRVHVVWFDMEELGLVGSARYVAEHQKAPVRAMLNFDINAYGDTVLFGPPAGGSNSTLEAMFSETCAAEKIDCVQFASMPPGDDRSFGRARIPTLSIATLPAAEAGQLRQLLEAAPGASRAPPAVLRIIHTPEDVIEKVDGASIARMHRLILAVLRRMSASTP
jgi:hypothetical protein